MKDGSVSRILGVFTSPTIAALKIDWRAAFHTKLECRDRVIVPWAVWVAICVGMAALD
jgi:hypothetical protein